MLNSGFSRTITGLVALGFAALNAVTPASAKLTINERTKFYSVSGDTGAALFKSIVRNGPKTTRDGHAIATTQTDLKIVNVKVGVKGNRCVVEQLDIRLNLTYTLPRWKGGKRSSQKFVRSWEKFLKLVKKHEDTHGRISREYARKLYSRLSKVTGRVSNGCQDFGNFSKRSIRLAQEDFISRHRNFDRREGQASSRIRRLQSALEVSK